MQMVRTKLIQHNLKQMILVEREFIDCQVEKFNINVHYLLLKTEKLFLFFLCFESARHTDLFSILWSFLYIKNPTYFLILKL